MTASLEHVNFTSADAEARARLLCDLFDWKVRWTGPAMDGGTTFHVGTDTAYIAVYSKPEPEAVDAGGAVNHIGVQVDDLQETRQRVEDKGIRVYGFGDYAPGRRFYFRIEDGVEFEVVSYG